MALSTITCPECQRTLKPAAPLAPGKKIRCPKCQAVFHVEFAPPKRAGHCDRCGSELVQRSDDTRETVENRLAVYESQTAPLIAYYRQRGLLSDIDGSGTVEQVQRRVGELLAANGLA